MIPSDSPPLLICEHCDSIFRRLPAGRTETAHCTRCGAILYRGSRWSTGDLFALTTAAALTFAIAVVSPVIRINASGLHNDVTLLQAIAAMHGGYAIVVGVLAAATLLLVPALQIALLLWVLSFAQARRRAPGFAVAMRTLHHLRPWSMTEVFMLGVLVAIIKLSGLLDVVAGPGTYATMASAVLVTLVAKRDVRQLWEEIPESA